MKKRKLLMSTLMVMSLSTPLNAEPVVIAWADLKPSSATIDNPFESLQPEQLDSLRRILKLERGPQTDASVEEVKALREQMVTSGIDVDALFMKREEIMQQRRQASEAISEDLIGQDVRLPGYLLPLDFKDGKAIEFLLVPTVGACIHTPPPPANQMVHVLYPEGFEATGLYTPVWVSGKLAAEKALHNIRYSDGESDVMVSYTLKPESVTPY